jgi:hypothetical protein
MRMETLIAEALKNEGAEKVSRGVAENAEEK